MDRNATFCLAVLIFATFNAAFARVPSSGNQIRHPDVLTRPPTVLKTSNGRHRHRNRWSKSRSTTAPAEVDDDNLTTTLGYGNYGQQRGFGYGRSNGMYNTVTSYYDYGTGTHAASGGTSWEYDDDYATTVVSTSFSNSLGYNTNNREQNNGYNNYNWNQAGSRNSQYRNTLPKPTTAIPTTTTAPPTEAPEAEEKNSLTNSLFGSSSGFGGGGYCFCSPLKSCPAQSIPRRGLCVNLISYLTNIQFIRCCYSPSLSKRMVK